MSSPAPRPEPSRTRQPVRWSTHSQLIALIVVATLGGTMFGVAFAVWPQSDVERVLGVLILAGVLALLVWVAVYLRRPVGGSQRPDGGRRTPPRR